MKRNMAGLLAIIRFRTVYVVDPNTLNVVWSTNAAGSGGIKALLFHGDYLLLPEGVVQVQICLFLKNIK